MKIGFLTCSDKPDLTPSDRVASSYLNRHLNLNVKPLIWGKEVNESDFDLIIVRSAWDYYKKIKLFNQYLMSIKVPILNPLELILWNQDKRYLLDLLGNGVAIVPSLFANKENVEELKKRIETLGWQNLVVKPTISASANHTYKTTASQLFKSSMLKSIFQRSDIIVQPFMNEVILNGEISAIFFKAKNKPPKLSHAVLKKAKAHDFRVQSEYGGSVTDIELSKENKSFSELILSKIPGEWLYARVDIIETQQGPLLGELELIEPDLFFDRSPAKLSLFSEAVRTHLG